MKKGFTLIELLVVISIVGLLTTAVIFDGVRSKRITALDREAREILVLLRETQNKSLITQEEANGKVPCGFGVHYQDDKTLIVFSEETQNAGEICAASSTPDQTQNIDRLYQAPGGYGIDKVLSTSTLTAADYVKIASPFPDIYFEPPDGITYINGYHDNTIASSTDITLCLRSNCAHYQRTIRVYLGGDIEIVD